jgi:hypothetical protein
METKKPVSVDTLTIASMPTLSLPPTSASPPPAKRRPSLTRYQPPHVTNDEVGSCIETSSFLFVP